MCDGELELEQYLISEVELIDRLLALLDPAAQSSQDVLDNLQQFMDEAVQRCRKLAMEKNQEYNSAPAAPSPLLAYVLREDTVRSILTYTFQGNDASLECGMEILLTLVSEPQRQEDDPEPTERDHMRHQEGEQIGRK